MNIMYHKFKKDSKVAALCLDVGKVFDQLEWPYMVRVLEECGLVSRFVSWIITLYAHPTSSVLTNREVKAIFITSWDTSRMSPQFFAFCGCDRASCSQY